jgi:phosphoketolase
MYMQGSKHVDERRPAGNPATPSLVARLCKELCRLRENGLADPQDRLHQYEVLLRVARALSSELTDLARVKDVLEQASNRLGSVYGPTVRVMFELTDQSQSKRATVRDRLAYDVFCAAQQGRLLTGQEPQIIVLSTFCTRKKYEILRDLARQLLHMLNEEQGRKQLISGDAHACRR